MMNDYMVNDAAVRAAMVPEEVMEDKPFSLGEWVKVIVGAAFLLAVSYGAGVVLGGDQILAGVFR
jgi:hypothetical protein